VVVHFAARPQSRLHFRALQRQLGLSRQSLKNALDTLERLDLLRRTGEGQRVYYEAANPTGWEILRELIRVFATPAEVIGDLFHGVPGVQAALVFGSAVTGGMRADSDLDVLVVEDDADPAALGLATLEAGMVLGREIDLKRFTPAELRDEQTRVGSSYVKRVLDGPVAWAIGNGDKVLAA